MWLDADDGATDPPDLIGSLAAIPSGIAPLPLTRLPSDPAPKRLQVPVSCYSPSKLS
jgi:hypothetical protein